MFTRWIGAPSSRRSRSSGFALSPHSNRCPPRIHRSPGFVVASSGGSGTASRSCSPWRRADHLLGVVHDPLQFLVVEAQRGEDVLGQGLKFLGQPDHVPLREFGRAVVGDRETPHVRAFEVGGHRRDVRPSQRPGRFERAVAGDDRAVGRHHDRLLLAEAGERVRDGLEVSVVVGAGVGGVEVEVGDRAEELVESGYDAA